MGAQRSDELDARDAAQRDRERELDDKARRTATVAEAAKKEAAGRKLVLARREGEIREAQADLRKRKAQLARQSESLREREQKLVEEIERRESALQVDRQNVIAQQRRLEEAERLCQTLREEFDAERRRLAEERAELLQRTAEHNEVWERRVQEAESQWRLRNETLAQHEQFDQHRAAVEALHAEAMQTHRETLELRLVVNQVWRDLQGGHPPAAMTRALAEARRKLGEHVQREAASLARQREELKTLSQRLGHSRRNCGSSAKSSTERRPSDTAKSKSRRRSSWAANRNSIARNGASAKASAAGPTNVANCTAACAIARRGALTGRRRRVSAMPFEFGLQMRGARGA